MKVKLLIFLFSSILINAQLEKINQYEINKKTDNNSITYKIKGKIYETDNKSYFSSNNNIIYKKMTNDIIYFMVYGKRYLFVGYFPNTEEEKMLPFAYWDRTLIRLDIIDLENFSKKWTYHIDEKTNISMVRVMSFNPKDGDITYYNHLRPVKIIE